MTTAPARAASDAAADPQHVGRANIDVVIPTFNEELNLPHALRSVVGWADNIFVVDSESTDSTRQLAEELGARVVVQPWLGYARQKNWALDNLPISSDWVFILDADEAITPKLKDELLRISTRELDATREDGFYVNRLTYFLGRPIRHCGYFPSWNLRFFKHGRARYEDREVHEHMVVEGCTGKLKQLMLHEDRRGLEHFIAKHNRYSTLEAAELIRDRHAAGANKRPHLDRSAAWRRWLKYHVQPKVPAPWLWRFLYMYFAKLGLLDGANGLRFCMMLSCYDFFISMKLHELRQKGAHRNAEKLPQIGRAHV